jgi:hypothetical protein
MSQDRRTDPRAPVATSALVSRGDEEFGRFLVINLSAGGALLRGRRPVPTGQAVELEIGLPTGGFVKVGALILREGRIQGRPTFAVAFVTPPASTRESIGNAVRVTLERARRASTLLILHSEETCRALAVQLNRLGIQSFAVTTAVAAIHCLGETTFRTAIVDLYLGADDGREILVYLAGKHPGVRRILTSGEVPRVDLWQHCQEMTVGAPHALLAWPWTDATVKQALFPVPELVKLG